MKKKERGSITVEAALFLPLFFFAFLSIYNLIYFARAQLLIQYAADQAVKEVAQYTYILDKVGILEKMDSTVTGAGAFQENLGNIKENLDVIQQAASNASRGEMTITDGIAVGNTLGSAAESIYGYIDNPKSFIDGLLKNVKSFAREELSRYMMETVAKSCVNKQLFIAYGGGNPDEYLAKMGIIGTDGYRLKFKDSKWCENGSRDVRLIVDYEIASKLPFFELEPRHYRVCASTRVWSGVE